MSETIEVVSIESPSGVSSALVLSGPEPEVQTETSADQTILTVGHAAFPAPLPRNFLVRGADGEFTLDNVTFDLQNRTFYDDAGKLALIAPDNAWILPYVRKHAPAAVQTPPQPEVVSGTIPTEAKEGILKAGQAAAGRYAIIDGKAYDTQKGEVISLEQLAHIANGAEEQTATKSERYAKYDGASEMLVMTDLDAEPVLTVTKPMFDQMLQKEGWSAVMCAIVKKPIGKKPDGATIWEDYRYEMNGAKYELRRCRLDHITKKEKQAMEFQIKV